MKQFSSIQDWQNFRRSLKSDIRVGFIPTMGALHEGHVSLVKRSKIENDLTVVSIFVNPTQFDNPDDLRRYPRTPGKDIEMLDSAGVDAVILPDYEELYADNFRYQVVENDISKLLCGSVRPGHFTGVLTVVMKLLNLVQPSHAYFGEKDFQQLKLIEGMAKAFFMPVKIVACPTVREIDGLAKSSRNQRLSPENRQKATLIYRALSGSQSPNHARETLEREGFKVDYIEDHFGRRFAAAKLDNVRLIDNVPIF